MRRLHPLLSAFALAAALVLLPAGADAHPHVWVTVKATVLYDNGMITGLQQEWTFDEMYTAMAIPTPRRSTTDPGGRSAPRPMPRSAGRRGPPRCPRQNRRYPSSPGLRLAFARPPLSTRRH